MLLRQLEGGLILKQHLPPGGGRVRRSKVEGPESQGREVKALCVSREYRKGIQSLLPKLSIVSIISQSPPYHE